MEAWKEIKLGEVCKLKGGYAFKTEEFKIEGIPLVKISNIQNNITTSSNSDVFIEYEKIQYLKSFLLYENDVVIAMSGATTGKIGKVNEKFSPSFLNQRVGCFKAIDPKKLDIRLIYQIFTQETVIQYILGNAGSSAQPNISPSFIENIRIIIPTSITEQTKIANILSTADEAIAQTEQLIAKYQRIKTGLMQDLLTKGIDEHGNIRNKSTHKFVVKNGVEVPEEWEVVEFETIADKKAKWSLTGGPFGSNLKAEDYTISGIRIIQLQNIGDGEFKNSYKIYTSEKKANELLSCNIYPNEIILSKMGDPVARACFIPNSANRFLMASDGIRLLPDSKTFNRHFVLTYINYELFRDSISKIATGSTRQRIGLRDLKKMPFVKPTIVEQNRISRLILETENLIEAEQHNLQKLHSLKTGLMQDLLSGKVRVNDLKE